MKAICTLDALIGTLTLIELSIINNVIGEESTAHRWILIPEIMCNLNAQNIILKPPVMPFIHPYNLYFLHVAHFLPGLVHMTVGSSSH